MSKMLRTLGFVLVAILVIGGLLACGGGGGTGPTPVPSPFLPPPMGPPPVGPIPTTIILTVDQINPPSGSQQRYGDRAVVEGIYRIEGGSSSDCWALGRCVSIDGGTCVPGSEAMYGPLRLPSGEYGVSTGMLGGGSTSLGAFTSKFILLTVTSCDVRRVVSPSVIKTVSVPHEIRWTP